MFHHILLLLLIIPFANALRNVTVDDADPSIVYTPPSSWTRSENNTLDYGGSHMKTQDRKAIANFTFTGVAVYYLSSRWPYLVNTAVSLDGAASVLVDLTDHHPPTGAGNNATLLSTVLWGKSGLANAQHHLVMTVGNGQTYGEVDGFIYTVENGGPGAGPGPNGFPQTKPSNARVLGIILGTVLGIGTPLLVAVIVWLILYRRKYRKAATRPRILIDPEFSPAQDQYSPYITPFFADQVPAGGSQKSRTPTPREQYAERSEAPNRPDIGAVGNATLLAAGPSGLPPYRP